jgi:hypothetical protein
MRLLLLSSFLLITASCALWSKFSPAEVVQSNGNVYTLIYRTGSELDDRHYEDSFKAGAENACHEQSYKVLERTRNPSTLATVGQLIDKYSFYWVIECASS